MIEIFVLILLVLTIPIWFSFLMGFIAVGIEVLFVALILYSIFSIIL